jgi:hypothetical protein
MISVRIEEATKKRMEDYEQAILQKIYRTIDSSIDVCITRTLEARTINPSGLGMAAEDLQQQIEKLYIPDTDQYGQPISSSFDRADNSQAGKESPATTAANSTAAAQAAPTAGAGPNGTQLSPPSIGSPMGQGKGDAEMQKRSVLDLSPSPLGQGFQQPTQMQQGERAACLDDIPDRMAIDAGHGKRTLEERLADEAVVEALPGALTACAENAAPQASTQASDDTAQRPTTRRFLATSSRTNAGAANVQ